MTTTKIKPKPRTKAVVRRKSNEYLALSTDASLIAETIRDNLGGDTINERDLERVLIPAGGGRTWEIPSIDGVESKAEIEGVIAHWTSPRAYWSQTIDDSDGNAPPDCVSSDGVRGVGDPGGPCNTCPHNVWGSGKGNVGKACKEKRLLYLVRPTSLLPIVIQAPVTSITPIKKYMLGLAMAGITYYTAITKLGLERVEGGSYPYSRMILTMSGQLPDEMVAGIRSYREALIPTLDTQFVRDEG